jgi:hypothetical protein
MAVPTPSRIALAAQGRKLPARAYPSHCGGPQQHAAGDQRPAAQPVRQGTGDELAQAPDGRIQRRQQADLADREAAADELGVPAGLADQQRRQLQAEAGVGQAEVERFGPQPGPGGDESGEVGGEGDPPGGRRPR